MQKIYGDGIHDDTAAIQERIDSGVCEVCLPVPEKYYLISSPLELPSNFRLVLPRYAEVRLAAGSNCVMVRNKLVVQDNAKCLPADCYDDPVAAQIWRSVDTYSPDHPSENIELVGGIWNYNNEEQLPNPIACAESRVGEYTGYGMLFDCVKNLRISSLTIKDPANFAITLDRVSYFTVEHVQFDFNLGNPIPLNMDGIHINGNCHYGVIRDLSGSCYDDMIALNAHEGSRGDITNILIDGLYCDYCHSAVRLLAVTEAVKHVRITNVYGNFYQYCVGITKYYPGETTGHFDDITVDNIHAAKAMPARKGDFQHPPKVEWSLPYLWVQKETVVGRLTIQNVRREEKTLPVDTIFTEGEVDTLIIDNLHTTNATGKPMPCLHNAGRIRVLSMRNIDCEQDELLVNDGSIEVMQ